MKKITSAFNTQKIKNLLEFLAEKSFWIFIFFFLSSAYLIFSLLYQPITSQKIFSVDEKASAVQFDEKSFNGSLDQWKIKEKRLQEIDSRTYPDIFSEKIIAGTSSMPPTTNAPTSTVSSTIQSTPNSTTVPDVIDIKL